MSIRRVVIAFALGAPLVGQLTWTPNTVGIAPPPRAFAVAATITDAWDVLLFGGLGPGGMRNDTWRRAPAGWQQVATALSPPARVGAALSTSTSPVLFGGRGTNGLVLGDTWRFGNGTWMAGPSSGPAARTGAAMCESPGFGALHVLFGGTNDGQAFGDTWMLDASGWRQQTVAVAPPARHGHAMVARNNGGVHQAILFGGQDAVGNLLDDTWVLDAVASPTVPLHWVSPPAATRPSARTGHAMRYASNRDRVQMFGGLDASGVVGDMWEWDGATWASVATTAGPGPRTGAVFVDAPSNPQWPPYAGLLFGGTDGTQPFADTWRLTSTFAPSRSSFGPTSTLVAEVSGTPSASGAPWLGDTVEFRLSTPLGTMTNPYLVVGFSNTASSLGPLPLNLGAQFDYQALLVAPDILFAMPPTTPVSSMPIQVPSVQALVGTHVYLQGFGFQPFGAGSHWGASFGFDCVFGSR